jgi:hypothetical protein
VAPLDDGEDCGDAVGAEAVEVGEAERVQRDGNEGAGDAHVVDLEEPLEEALAEAGRSGRSCLFGFGCRRGAPAIGRHDRRRVR